ncbi:hypothetical protein QG37_05857 [Candidozyma auris]|nr:hypothetical protein QG37_05857 [[Candida] auris]
MENRSTFHFEDQMYKKFSLAFCPQAGVSFCLCPASAVPPWALSRRDISEEGEGERETNKKKKKKKKLKRKREEKKAIFLNS